MLFGEKSVLYLIVLFFVLGLVVPVFGLTQPFTQDGVNFQNPLIAKAENMSNTTEISFDVSNGFYSLLFFYQMGKHDTGKNYYPYLCELNVTESGIYDVGKTPIDLFKVPEKEKNIKTAKVTDPKMRLNGIYDKWNRTEPVLETDGKETLNLTFPYNNSCWYLFKGPAVIYSDVEGVKNETKPNAYDINVEALIVGEQKIEIVCNDKKAEMDASLKTTLSDTDTTGAQPLFYRHSFENMVPGDYIIEIYAIPKMSESDSKIKVFSKEVHLKNSQKKNMPTQLTPNADLIFKSENMSNTTTTTVSLENGKYEMLYFYQMGKHESGKNYYPYNLVIDINESGVFENSTLFKIPDKNADIKPAKVTDDELRLNKIYDFLNRTDAKKTNGTGAGKEIDLTYPYNNSCWYIFKDPSLLYSHIKYEKDTQDTSHVKYDINIEFLVMGDTETTVSLGEETVILKPDDKKTLSGTDNNVSKPLFYRCTFRDVSAESIELKIDSVSYTGEKKSLGYENIVFGKEEKAPITESKNVVIITGCTYQTAAADDLINYGFSQDPEKLIRFSHYQTTMTDIGTEPVLSNMTKDIENADIIYINMINTSVKGPFILNAYREAKKKNPAYSPIIFSSNLTDALFEKELEKEIPEDINTDAYKIDLYTYFSNSGYDKQNLENMIYKLLNDFENCRFDVKPANALPDNAIYHPDAENIVFATQKEYFNWYKNRSDGHKYNPDNGTVGIMFYASYYPGKIEPIDDTIRELEKIGLNVIPIYLYSSTASDVCPKYFQTDEGNGDVLVDVVLSLSRYLSTPPFDTEKYDIPVINAALTKLNKTEWEKVQNPYDKWMNRYYRPETSGMIDPINVGYTDMVEGVEMYFSDPDQIKYLVERTNGYIKLKNTDNDCKRVAVIYYNHDGGKDDIGASYLDVPASLSQFLKALHLENYNVDEKFAKDASEKSLKDTLVDSMLTYGYNVGNWAPGQLEKMAETGEIALVPSSVYKKWFEEFFKGDPDREKHMQQVIKTWGEAPGDLMTYKKDGEEYIVIPLVDVSENGNKKGRIIMAPQPSRGHFSDYSILYHDGALVPNHQYIAFYAWLQHSEEEGGYGADVIVYMGRHGTQEWLPGKETGMSRYDWPPLMHGKIPIVYYYIVDGISEGIQAKRRGNAVIVDHLTPAIVKSDIEGEYFKLGEAIVNYRNALLNNLDEQLTEEYKNEVFELAESLNINHMIKTDPIKAKQNKQTFEEYIEDIDETLYVIKTSSMPYGLHILGTSPKGDALISTIYVMLGQSYTDEIKSIADKHKVTQNVQDLAVSLLKAVILEKQDISSALNNTISGADDNDLHKIKPHIESAEKYAKGFKESENEIDQLLRAMRSGYIAPGVAGDPVTKPHILPTGYNFQTIDSTKVPSGVSQKLGQKLARNILDGYKENGSYPDTIAYILWSSETVRHEGVVESCILYLMGLEYDFTSSTTPTNKNLKLVDDFDHPTMDVVMQISGLYRDMFPDLIQRIDDAVVVASQVDNPKGNRLKDHIEILKKDLMNRNPDLSEEDAFKMASVRLFGPEPEGYGTGMANVASASDSWEERSQLGEYYIKRMGHCYANRTIGPNDVMIWGLSTKEMEKAALGSISENGTDVFKQALKSVKETVHSRSTNLYGVLDNDDFFQYLGGLNLAVATLNEGKYPDSFVMDLKKPGSENMTELSSYIKNEASTRYFNPYWAEGMMQHGYAGAREMSDFVENLWGWESMMPDVVGDSMWKGVYEIYVKEGNISNFLNEKNNAYSFQSIAGRLLEAARTGNWEPTDDQLKDILKKQIESVVQNGATCCHHTCGNPSASEFIAGMMSQLNVVDENTAKAYNDIMREVHQKTKTDEIHTSKSSNRFGKASVLLEDQNGTIPIENTVNKTTPDKENETSSENRTKTPIDKNETSGEGFGKDPGTQAGQHVSGIAMIQKTVDNTTRKIMDYLNDPTFSAANFVAVFIIILIVGIVFYGYRKKGM